METGSHSVLLTGCPSAIRAICIRSTHSRRTGPISYISTCTRRRFTEAVGTEIARRTRLSRDQTPHQRSFGPAAAPPPLLSQLYSMPMNPALKPECRRNILPAGNYQKIPLRRGRKGHEDAVADRPRRLRLHGGGRCREGGAEDRH